MVDDERNLIISETFHSFEITAVRTIAYPEQDLTDFPLKADFPNHKLIVKPNTKMMTEAMKGISTLQELKEAIELCSKQSRLGNAVIESDLSSQNVRCQRVNPRASKNQRMC